jgi:hypothetical protein
MGPTLIFIRAPIENAGGLEIGVTSLAGATASAAAVSGEEGPWI